MTQSFPCVETPRVLGFDVAKAEIVVHDLTTRRIFKIRNSQTALRAALATFSGYELAVCETTGGYENALLSVCQEIGLPIHRAHAKRIKSFIDSHGRRAKADAIGAAWIARYGAERFATLTHAFRHARPGERRFGGAHAAAPGHLGDAHASQESPRRSRG
jgi:transposase